MKKEEEEEEEEGDEGGVGGRRRCDLGGPILYIYFHNQQSFIVLIGLDEGLLLEITHNTYRDRLTNEHTHIYIRVIVCKLLRYENIGP